MDARKNRLLVFGGGLVLIVVLAVFQSHFAVANEGTTRSVQMLLNSAREANSRGDDEAFDATLEKLFVAVTRYPIGLNAPPEGVSEDAFVDKVCEYHRLVEQVFTPEYLEQLRLHRALWGFVVVFRGDPNDVMVRIATECRSTEGQLLATSRFMIDGMAWAESFQAANTERKNEMALEIKALAQRYPDNLAVETLSNLVRMETGSH